MAGLHPSSTSYAMTRALLSLYSSPRLPESLEDSLNIVGMIRVDIRKMRKPLYFQWTENRFTGSLRLSTLSIVVQIMALALEDAH
jgi:hypothetical protein